MKPSDKIENVPPIPNEVSAKNVNFKGGVY